MNTREEALWQRKLAQALIDIEWLKREHLLLSQSGGAPVGTDQLSGLTGATLDGDGGGGTTLVRGRLTSDITAASNGLTGATTFTFKLWSVIDGDTNDPHELEEASENTTGVNRDKHFSFEAAAETYVICALIGGEYHPVYVGCLD